MKIQPEWIEWKGGDQPVDDDTLVAYELRDGSRGIRRAGSFSWWCHYGNEGDIIAYAVGVDIEPYKPKPKWTVFTTSLDDNTLQYKGVGKGGFYSTETAQRIADALNAAGVEL